MPYRLTYTGLLLVVVVCLLLLASARAQAAPVVDKEMTLSKNANRLTQGPDGNMWATLAGVTGNEIARITPQGDVTEFDNDTLTGAVGIVSGPGGKLWVTIGTQVVRFDPASPTTPAPLTDVFAADIVQPQSIVSGPDGNLWTASADKVLRITPAGVVTPFTVLTGARGIASAGGLLWVADFGAQEIVSVTPDGTPTRYPLGTGGPQDVAAGLGGQVGFTNPGSRVGRLVAGGSPLQTDAATGSDPFGMAFGADEAYWFAQPISNNLGRLSATGEYTQLGGLSAGAGPRYLAPGPNNTLWVALQGLGGVDAKKIARVSGVEPLPAPNPIPIFDERTRIAALKLTPKRFRVAKGRTPIVARKRGPQQAPAGTTVRFTLLNEAATVRLTVEKRLRGRKSGKRCVAPTRKLRSHRGCPRFVKHGRGIVRKGLEPGAQRIAFSGRIGRRALAPGRYRLTAVATGSKGKRSTSKRASFTVLPAGR